MRLDELALAVPGARILGEPGVVISGLAYHSAAAGPGALFVCIPGFSHDGHGFAWEAVRRGAVAVVVERVLDLPPAVSQLVVADARAALARLSACYYRYPARRLRVVGVTGTNGKTTITHMVDSIFRAAGLKTGLVGTVGHRVGDLEFPAERTTPESADLQELLAAMVRAGCTHTVLELSSQALALRRADACDVDLAVCSNVTHDHLEFHKDFHQYRLAKARLFWELTEQNGKAGPRWAVLNAHDPSTPFFASRTQVPVLRYGFDPQADVWVRPLQPDRLGQPCHLIWRPRRDHGPAPGAAGVEVGLVLRVPGRANLANALAAAAVALCEGIDPQAVAAGLEAFEGVPGRWEVICDGDPLTVVVDYAHNPDGLAATLETAHLLGFSPIVLVFSCEGVRGREKRPLMGRIAAQAADYVVATCDHRYDEAPEGILGDIEVGLRAGGMGPGQYALVPDREEAIHHGVARGRPGGLVLVTGRGHEQWIIVRGKKMPLDDRQVARAALDRHWPGWAPRRARAAARATPGLP